MHYPYGYFACLNHTITAIVPVWGPSKLAAQKAAKTQADARRLAKARAAARTKAGRERRAAKQRRDREHEPPPRRRSPQTPVLCAYAPKREREGEWGAPRAHFHFLEIVAPTISAPRGERHKLPVPPRPKAIL